MSVVPLDGDNKYTSTFQNLQGHRCSCVQQHLKRGDSHVQCTDMKTICFRLCTLSGSPNIFYVYFFVDLIDIFRFIENMYEYGAHGRNILVLLFSMHDHNRTSWIGQTELSLSTGRRITRTRTLQTENV